MRSIPSVVVSVPIFSLLQSSTNLDIITVYQAQTTTLVCGYGRIYVRNLAFKCHHKMSLLLQILISISAVYDSVHSSPATEQTI